jgi:hypothetical protein
MTVGYEIRTFRLYCCYSHINFLGLCNLCMCFCCYGVVADLALCLYSWSQWNVYLVIYWVKENVSCPPICQAFLCSKPFLSWVLVVKLATFVSYEGLKCIFIRYFPASLWWRSYKLCTIWHVLCTYYHPEWTDQAVGTIDSPWHNCLRQNGDPRPFWNFRCNCRSNVTVKCLGIPANSRRPWLKSRPWERLFWLKFFCCSFLASPGKCQYRDFFRWRHDVFFFHFFQIHYTIMLLPLDAL